MFLRFVSIVSLQLTLALSAMTATVPTHYWQQEVGYTMNVSLDNEKHGLLARSYLTYINHSPDTLNQIFMHLYPNAFNKGTLLDQNWMDQGSRRARNKERTGITVNKIVHAYTDLEHEIRDDTILEIQLDQALQPGDTLEFRMDWESLIHRQMDRSGWRGEQYDMGQWYPKFVVYDENGWNLDPFGDWGEFYGEFGRYDVTLDVPAGYIVGATGVVVAGDPGWESVRVDTSISWEDWYADFILERDSVLTSLDSTARDTVQFIAENVHDFAWLASPDFVYEHGQWDGIDIHVLFTPAVGADWTRVVVERSENIMEWLSIKIGRYVWPQMTVTKALLGGGMEYPMLVMNQTDGDGLIAHELAHNWFYGMLASNEFDQGWMDEGLTSFFEEWYVRDAWPKGDYRVSRGYYTDYEFEHMPLVSDMERHLQGIYDYMESPHNDPMYLMSPFYRTYDSYYLNSYDKATTMLMSLKNYLGEDRFLAGIQLYFQRWHLKHVPPEAFYRAMEVAAGEELDWFFDQWLQRTGWVDYELVGWEALPDGDHYVLKAGVQRNGLYHAPVDIVVFSNEGDSLFTPLKNFVYRDYQEMELDVPFRPGGVIIDPHNVFLDVDLRNNRQALPRAFRYDWRGWDYNPAEAVAYPIKPLVAFSDAGGLKPGVQVRRVYRHYPTNAQLGLWVNGRTQTIDGNVLLGWSFRGLPFKSKTTASFSRWNQIQRSGLSWDLDLQVREDYRPMHTAGATLNHVQHETSNPGATELAYTLFQVEYSYASTFLGSALLDLSFNLTASPEGLGSWNQSFTANEIRSDIRWKRLRWRTTLAGYHGNVPGELYYRLVGPNDLERHFEPFFSTLDATSSLSELGSHVYSPDVHSFRGLGSDGNLAVPYLWISSLDVSRNISGRWYRPKLGQRLYADFGQSSLNGVDWTWHGASGVEIIWQPKWERKNLISALLRPFNLGIMLPVATLSGDKVTLGDLGTSWLIHFSWHERDGAL